MAKVIVFYKRCHSLASSFEAVPASNVPAIPDRALTEDEVFSMAIVDLNCTIHPFATIAQDVPSATVEVVVGGLNSLYLAFAESRDVGMYQILEILARLPGRVEAELGASTFLLPGPEAESCRKQFATEADASEALQQKNILAGAGIFREDAAVMPLRISHGQTAVALALSQELPQDTPSSRLHLNREAVQYEDFSASSIAAARAAFLEFVTACRKVNAHIRILREDVRDLTKIGMDIVGIPGGIACEAVQPRHIMPVSLPCTTLTDVAALDDLADKAVGKALIETAVRAATRGCPINRFHKRALHGLFSDAVLSVFYIESMADFSCPYPAHGRAAFPEKILSEYVALCEKRCSDVLTSQERMFFWFGAFAELEASYKRQNFRDEVRTMV